MGSNSITVYRAIYLAPQPGEEWEVGLFGRDLLESYHVETMYPGIDVEPARVERTFLLSITKRF